MLLRPLPALMTRAAREPVLQGPFRGVLAGLWLVAVLAAASVGAAGAAGSRPDPYRPRQWALDQIGAARAWPVTTGEGIRVGVVDTGIDLTHEDLADKVEAATNCVGSQGDPAACSGSAQDLEGHGTIVSGIVAADTGNGRGIAGVAPGARLVVARALGGHGPEPVGTPADVNAAIRWVVDHGARVVNLSLGVAYLSGREAGSPLTPALQYVWDHGAIPVVASGNVAPGTSAPGDAGYVGVNTVVVGATGRSGAVAPYSRPFPSAPWSLVAPGGSGGTPNGASFSAANVLSTAPTAVVREGYAYAAGTSLAAPHVAGALALLLAQGVSPLDAVQLLLKTADRSQPCGAGCKGRLDVARAVSSASSSFSLPATTTPPLPATRPTDTTGSPAAMASPAGSPATVPDLADVAAEPSLPADPQPRLAAGVSTLSPTSSGMRLPGPVLLLVAGCPLVVGTVVRRWARVPA